LPGTTTVTQNVILYWSSFINLSKMIRIGEMKQQKSLGGLREDLQISGMKTEVAGYVPKGESVDVGITGMKSEIKLTGDGRVHVTLGGMKSKAVLAPSLDATIDQIGMKSTAVRRSVDAITAPADQKTSSSATNSQSLECPVCHVSYNPT